MKDKEGEKCPIGDAPEWKNLHLGTNLKNMKNYKKIVAISVFIATIFIDYQNNNLMNPIPISRIPEIKFQIESGK